MFRVASSPSVNLILALDIAKRTFWPVSILVPLILVTFASAQPHSKSQDSVVASEEQIRFYTYKWDGDRLPDGRPKVADDLLERLKNVKVEDAWQFMYGQGYDNQYEGGWEMLHSDVPIVGRALTAVYMPRRPDVHEQLLQHGHGVGHKGEQIHWPINLLQNGDVYVADNFGKAAFGTLIGDKLGNTIYAKTGTGVVFDGAIRDAETLVALEGFNVFARHFHPTYSGGVMLMGINVPIRIGDVAVMPGDVILAKRIGLVVIPPHFVEPIVVTAEIVRLRDEFVHERVRQGVYTANQVDAAWTTNMEEDFLGWVEDGRLHRLPVTLEEMHIFLQQRTW